MLKQALTQTCICSRSIEFPEGEVKATCPCGAKWDLGPEGYWYTRSIITPLAPILAKPVVCSVKSKVDRYRNYPKSRRKNKGRKAGSRCC